MSNKNVPGATCDKCGSELVMGDKIPHVCYVKEPVEEPKPEVKVKGRGR